MLELISFLLFSGWAAVREAEEGPSARRPVNRRPQTVDQEEDPAVLQAKEEFLPYTAEQIETIQRAHPDATTWKKIGGYLPYLTESVAMYYVMWDPAVPNAVKLEVAAALLYAISPFDLIPDQAVPIAGWFDDAAFLAGVLYQVYGYIDRKHVRKAQDWLLEHGVEPTPIFSLGKQFEEEVPSSPAAQIEQRYGEEVNVRPSERDVDQALSLARCINTTWPGNPTISAGHDRRTGQMHLVVQVPDPDWYRDRGFPTQVHNIQIRYASTMRR